VSIDRAALIEAAAAELPTFVGQGGALDWEKRETAGEVLDAVLPLIADAIEAEASATVKWDHPEWCQGYGVGMSAAESVVRGLATRTGDDEPVICGNCGRPYPGEHIIEPGSITCPTHTARDSLRVVHDGFIGSCDQCAVYVDPGTGDDDA
jgi:hypothetical protein